MKKRNVPFFSLKKQTEQLKTSLIKTITNIIETQQFIGGSIITDFEKKLASQLNAAHTISCNSGTDALWLALKALQLQHNTIVLTTPFSFIASASEIVAHGAHPTFVDINPHTLTLCPLQLEQWLQQQTRRKGDVTIHIATGMPVVGIIPVDLFGQCADHTTIKAIADAWGLWIIEDACQAIGSSLDTSDVRAQTSKRMAGTFGDIGTLSFYPTKNLGGIGDGGACITNNAELAQRLMQLRNHGRSTHYAYQELGINSRMDTIQAAALSIKLDHLDAFNKKRQHHAAHYHQQLANTPGITLPTALQSTHVYHQYAIRLTNNRLRDTLAQHLEQQDVGTRIFYPELLSDIPFLQTHATLASNYPVARNAVDTILCLPIWPELTEQDIAYVCHHIDVFMKQEATQAGAATNARL